MALAAIAQLVSAWTEDAALAAALDGLPALMEAARTLDWSPAETALAQAGSLYVVERGPGFAAAQEAALKFKETCGLQAEAFRPRRSATARWRCPRRLPGAHPGAGRRQPPRRRGPGHRAGPGRRHGVAGRRDGSGGVDLPDALRMASLQPAQFIGLDHEIGRITPGQRADLVLLDEAGEAQVT